ncbi:hypothetical protein ACIBP6_03035 [Nonomuraea terrae]|uniref:hypothetical protein n=1 Tax=Nonomuraea terrae TaxID=2530383 RepID=UPI003789CD06
MPTVRMPVSAVAPATGARAMVAIEPASSEPAMTAIAAFFVIKVGLFLCRSRS